MKKNAIITGAAGFIGNNLYNAMKAKSYSVVACDDNLLSGAATIKPNEIFDFIEKESNIEVIFHQGACTDTTCYDAEYMMTKNFDYSAKLLRKCIKNDIRFIYASSAGVYGDGPFVEGTEQNPKNIYANSKYLFDKYAECFLNEPNIPQIVGLRYYNVFGPLEHNKGKMASTIYQFYQQIKKDKKIKIFKNSNNYRRDFVSVEDVVSVNLHFLKNKDISGIYNCGTGAERSFYDIVDVLKERYKFAVEEIEMPEAIKEKYQKFTSSDNTKLKTVAKYTKSFATLEEGINKYLDFLEQS